MCNYCSQLKSARDITTYQVNQFLEQLPDDTPRTLDEFLYWLDKETTRKVEDNHDTRRIL